MLTLKNKQEMANLEKFLKELYDYDGKYLKELRKYERKECRDSRKKAVVDFFKNLFKRVKKKETASEEFFREVVGREFDLMMRNRPR